MSDDDLTVPTPTDLLRQLQDHEDVETAVAVYKDANDARKVYNRVKRHAKDLIEAELTDTGEIKRDTEAGTAGWMRRFDADSFDRDLIDDPDMAERVQRLQERKVQLEEQLDAVSQELKDIKDDYKRPMIGGRLYIR